MDINHESIISKIFKINTSLSQSKHTQARDLQEEEIRMGTHLSYGKVISEKVWCILISHKIRSTFYTGSTLRKLLSKPKDWVATENKNKTVYEIDCSEKQSPSVFCKKEVLKNFAKITGKHLSQSLFFNNVAGLGLQLY